MARNLDEPGANFNQLLELSIKLENARTFAGTKVASADEPYNWQQGDWTDPDDESVGPTKILEDFEITDEMRRKPNAAGGRIGYGEGDIVPKPKPKDYAGTLKMLFSQKAWNTLGPRTWTDLTFGFAKKAHEAGQISDATYKKLMMPMFGEKGEKITKAIEERDAYHEAYNEGGRVGFQEGMTELQIKIKQRFPNANFSKGIYGFSKAENPTLYERARGFVRSLTGERAAYYQKPGVKERTRELHRSYYADPEKRKKILAKNIRNITKPEQALKRKKYLQDRYYYGGQREKDLARLRGITISKNLGAYLQSPDNVLIKDMIRASEKGNANIKLIRGGPNNTVVAVQEGEKIYHAVGSNRKPIPGAPKDSISIIKHPSFKKRFEITKKTKAFANTKVPNTNITYGTALDILESEKAGTPIQKRNPAEYEHVKGVKKDPKKGQIALRTANRQKQVIMTQLKEGHITKSEADRLLKKLGVRSFVDGRYIGAPKIDVDKQFIDLKKYIDRKISTEPSLIKKVKIAELEKIPDVTTAAKLEKSVGKKTLEEGAKKTLKKSALKGAAKALRFIPGLGLVATAGFGAYGLYDAIKKGYTDPGELLASAAWGSGVEFKDKEEKKKEGIASLKV